MTRSMDYQGRKHLVVKPVAANDQIATGKTLKPMKFKDDEQMAALNSPQKPPVPYDVHIKDSLTYFQFYLDEVVQSANAPELVEKRQSISTTALLGAGFVAATVVSGLLIGDALNKPIAPPSDTKMPPAKPKQRAMFLAPRPTSAPPEKLADTRFVTRSQRESQPQAISRSSIAPSQNLANQAIPQSFAPMLPSVTLAAAPETLTVRPAKRTVTGTPVPAGMKPLVRPAYQELPDLQRPPQSPITAFDAPVSTVRESLPPRAIAAPERINSGQPALSSPDPTQPPATLTNPISPSPSSAETPATPQAENQLTAPQPSPSEPETSTAKPPQLNSTSSRIESKLPNRAIKTALAENRSAIAASSTDLSSQPVPSRLQDFVTLAQSTPVATRTFMPLTEQAAAEAGQHQQFEKFAIRQVAAQDYQKEWLASSKSLYRSGYPAYGFIDYQRQVIVVLTEQPQVNPVQSQKATPPNS